MLNVQNIVENCLMILIHVQVSADLANYAPVDGLGEIYLASVHIGTS